MKTKRMKSSGYSRRNLPQVLLRAALVTWTSPALLAQTSAPATADKNWFLAPSSGSH